MKIPRSLRMVVVGFVAKYIARLATRRSVDSATKDLEDRLPPAASKVVAKLPDGVLRTGGAAIAAGKATRTAARSSASVASVAKSRSLSVTGELARVRQGVRQMKTDVVDDIIKTTEEERRLMTGDVLRETVGREAADNASLDLRETPSPEVNQLGPDANLPTEADAVRPGRRRGTYPRHRSAVARVQRLYNPRPKPWD